MNLIGIKIKIKQLFYCVSGLFVITSCNWTEEEIITHFSQDFDVKTVIPTPQFKFGGKVGSVVSSVVFVKK